MLKEITTLSPFFENPYKVFSAREIARKTGINHITVSKKLREFVFIERAKNGPYMGFKAKFTTEFVRLRWFYNIDKLFNSKFIEKAKEFYDLPTIIIFGSYATATNTSQSDIDIAIISTHKKKMTLSEYEKFLGHKIQLFLYTKKDIEKMKKENPELLNSICNGIVLNGELEVFI
ncbi:MAG: nucleotidyltransferase domain-containing protein [Nanobdellota archaeon]